jgi:acetate---CoA ligase (ADP-forming)
MTALPARTVADGRLARLLRPRSVAAFGGHAAAEVVRQCDKIGFSGDVWVVHPQHAQIEGRKVYRCAADLPSAPDAAFIGVNRHASVDVMADLSAIGAGGAVAFASGFAEAGEAALQQRLCTAAAGMPYFGPNCYGFINYLDRALVWPDQHGGMAVERGVAIITQSGNIGINLTMQKRALPIGYLITLGNQAAAGPAAVMGAVLDDPRVTAIGLHMEGVSEPLALARMVARARAQGVPVVALKTGRSAAGAQIALSHTASMASADGVVDAFFRRIGVARVDDIPTLLETLKLLHYFGPLPGRSIASLSCSGGEAALIADSATAAGVQFLKLSAETVADIGETLPPLVSISNPMDYHTFGWRNRTALAATFGAMMRAGADLNLLILDFPRPDKCDTADWDIAAGAMEDAASAAESRAAILATLPEAMPEDYAVAMAARGIVPLLGMAEALQAIKAAAVAGEFAGAPEWLPCCDENDTARVGAVTVSEWEGKRRLAAFGVAVPEGALAQNEDEAVRAALSLGLPVALKAAGTHLAHKTEHGGVRLNLASAEAVRSAAAHLLRLTGQVLVERMVSDVVAELIVGVARDATLGHYLVLGSGGVLAELVGDTAMLMVPATRTEIRAALDGLRVARLLHGYRGGSAGDIDSAIESIMAIQAFALAHLRTLQELDVNPMMVRRAGLGAVAADVLLRLVPDARCEVHHG